MNPSDFILEPKILVDGNVETSPPGVEPGFWGVYRLLPPDGDGIRLHEWVADCAKEDEARVMMDCLKRKYHEDRRVRRNREYEAIKKAFAASIEAASAEIQKVLKVSNHSGTIVGKETESWLGYAESHIADALELRIALDKNMHPGIYS